MGAQGLTENCVPLSSVWPSGLAGGNCGRCRGHFRERNGDQQRGCWRLEGMICICLIYRAHFLPGWSTVEGGSGENVGRWRGKHWGGRWGHPERWESSSWEISSRCSSKNSRSGSCPAPPLMVCSGCCSEGQSSFCGAYLPFLPACLPSSLLLSLFLHFSPPSSIPPSLPTWKIV